MLKGFRTFLMQGELIVVAVGLVVALAFNTLINAFCTDIITPLVNSAEGASNHGQGLGFTVNHQWVNLGSLVSSVIYFVIFAAVIYCVLVLPYRAYMQRRGTAVFGPPAPHKSCPACCSSDLPVAATKCLHCASEVS